MPLDLLRTSQAALVVKNPPANAGDPGELGSIPGSGRSPGGGHVSPLQFSCLENPMDRGVWWATVHKIAKESDTAEGAWHNGTKGVETWVLELGRPRFKS